MKTIIIDLPDDLSAESVCYAVASVANEIGSGTLTITPPFCHSLNADGIRVTVRSEAEADNQAHPPLNTPLSAFTPAMLAALPVGSAFGESSTTGGIVEKRANGWHLVSGGECVDFPDGYNGDRPLIRVGPEQASEPAPSATLPDPAPVREPLPFPVRRYGSARTWNQPDGERRFDVGYEFFGCAAGPRDVSESRTFDTEAEGHAWLMSVMMDPGPLPDPWPNMLVDADVGSERHRARIFSAYMIGDRTWACIDVGEGRRDVQWTASHIHEVRTPDGATVWKRPAAKVTT